MDIELSKLSDDIKSEEIYKQLSQKWYQENNHAMALFRSQSHWTTPWILSEIRKHIGYSAKIIDISCGAGFFSNEAVKVGHKVTAMDISTAAIKVAKLNDETQSVDFIQGDAYKIPFSRGSFDVVVGLDLLGNISDPEQVFFEASRVLRPGGLFFFQAVNRNFLSYMFVEKAMEMLFDKNESLAFVYSLFRKPEEIADWVEDSGMDLEVLRGVMPVIFQKAFWKLPWTHQVQSDFKYKWTKSTLMTYVGYAKKLREQ
jgi:2-polyprenyl-6-hydroxyphenyl methylase/3-demethylubiquinone-9 3-methyltransferase